MYSFSGVLWLWKSKYAFFILQKMHVLKRGGYMLCLFKISIVLWSWLFWLWKWFGEVSLHGLHLCENHECFDLCMQHDYVNIAKITGLIYWRNTWPVFQLCTGCILWCIFLLTAQDAIQFFWSVSKEWSLMIQPIMIFKAVWLSFESNLCLRN